MQNNLKFLPCENALPQTLKTRLLSFKGIINQTMSVFTDKSKYHIFSVADDSLEAKLQLCCKTLGQWLLFCKKFFCDSCAYTLQKKGKSSNCFHKNLFISMWLLTVIADMKSHRAEVVTGDRVNFGLHGDRLVAYITVCSSKRIWYHMAHMLHAILKKRTNYLFVFILYVVLNTICWVFCFSFLVHINYNKHPDSESVRLRGCSHCFL